MGARAIRSKVFSGGRALEQGHCCSLTVPMRITRDTCVPDDGRGEREQEGKRFVASSDASRPALNRGFANTRVDVVSAAARGGGCFVERRRFLGGDLYYDERRWERLRSAVNSLREQTLAERDHRSGRSQPGLLRRAERDLERVRVVGNSAEPGLRGARNSGLMAASASLVAFLDDDAEAESRWLELLAGPYDDPDVAGVGGLKQPARKMGRPPCSLASSTGSLAAHILACC